MLTKRKDRKLQPNEVIQLHPGSKMSIVEMCSDRSEKTLLTHTIDKAMKINYLIAFDIENELGMHQGIAGAFGEKVE